jgi:DNA-binding NtrC family response regulator
MTPSILLIEDEATLARNICIYLEREGLVVESASSGEVGLQRLEQIAPQLVILDYNLPGINGIQVLQEIMQKAPRTRVIMLTGAGSEQIAVDALKAGASDYLRKPVELAALRMVIERVLSRRRFEEWPRAVRESGMRKVMDTMLRRRAGDADIAQQTSWRGKLVLEPMKTSVASAVKTRASVFPEIIGESEVMMALKTMISRIIDADLRVSGTEPPSVLIAGETGTGKELVARALHYEGRRKAGPFIEINCAGIPATLLESELFGHERGAFTDAKESKLGLIEAANGGTLFLDEIGEFDLGAQAKLLKVIENRKVRPLGGIGEKAVDVNFIAATSRDLEQMVRDGQFRADLYYRLRMIRVVVPPLRERVGDIAKLAEYFAQATGLRYGKPQVHLSSDAIAAIARHSWQGNVRELKHAIEQAVLLTENTTISAADLSLQSFSGSFSSKPGIRLAEVEDRPDAERELLLETLRETRLNISKAARLLGISRDTMRYRIKKHALEKITG